MPVENWSEEDVDTLDLESTEIDEVLAALRTLLAKVESPVVRACLEEAHDDIAHLMESGPLAPQAEDETDVA